MRFPTENDFQSCYFQLQIKVRLPLVFKSNNVSPIFSQKHLGVVLDPKLRFEDHLNNVLAKVDKIIGFLGKLRNLLSRTLLITIYKAFI